MKVGMVRGGTGCWALDLLIKELKCQAKQLGHGYADKGNHQIILCWKKTHSGNVFLFN